MKNTLDLLNKPTVIVEIPPIRDSNLLNIETRVLNTTIAQNLESSHRNTVRIAYREKIRRTPLNEILRDNLHLRRGEITKTIAQEINYKTINLIAEIPQKPKPSTSRENNPNRD